MALSKLEILIEARVGKAVEAINDVNERIDTLIDLQERSAKASEEMGRSFGFNVRQIGLGVIAANLATDAIRRLTSAATGFIGESIRVANAVERVNATLPVLAANTGRSREEIERIRLAIREENKSLLEATEITRGIIIAGLKEADALRLVKVARDVGATAGINSSRVNKLVLDSVLTLNPGLLKQAGIAVSLNVVFRELAAQLGKNIAELTTAERQQGLFNAIMAEGEKFAGAYEAAMTTVEKISRSVADASKDINLVVGDLLNDALKPIAQAALDAVRAFRAWAFTTENELRPVLVDLGRTIGVGVLVTFRTTIETVRVMTGVFTAWFEVMRETQVFSSLRQVLKVVAIGISFVIESIIDFIDKLAKSRAALIILTGVLTFFAGVALAALVAALSPVIIAMGVIAAVAVAASVVYRQLTKDFTDFFLRVGEGFPLIRQTIIRWAETTLNAVESVALAIGDAGLVGQIGNAKIALQEAARSARRDAGELDKLRQIVEETGSSTFSLAELFRKAKQAIADAANTAATAWLEPKLAIEDFSDSIDGATKKTKDFGDETDRELRIVLGLWDNFIKQIEIFDTTTEAGQTRFAKFLQNSELDIEEFADVFIENQREIVQGFREMTREAEREFDNLVSEFKRAQEEITRLIDRNSKEQRNIQVRSQEDVANAVLKAEGDIERLRQKIADSRANLLEDEGDAETRAQNKIAEERASIEKLKQILTEKTGQVAIAIQEELAAREVRILNITRDTTKDINKLREEEQAKIQEVETELQKRQDIAERAAQLDIGFINAINEAREVAKLNEIDRILFEANKRQEARQVEFTAEKARLQSKLDNLAIERSAVEIQIADLTAKREISERFITDLLRKNLIERTKDLQDTFVLQNKLVDDATSKWERLGGAISNALLTISSARPLGVSVPAFAGVPMQEGGIVTKPTLALIGERGREAVIPLDRGGGVMGAVNVTITGNTIFTDDVERLAKQVGDAIIRRLNLNIRIG